MGIKGRDGIDLDEKWKDGVVTNVGMIVNGEFSCNISKPRWNYMLILGRVPKHVHVSPLFLKNPSFNGDVWNRNPRWMLTIKLG